MPMPRTINLPAKITHGQRPADFEALGLTFGNPPEEGDLFRRVTLPEGWTTEADDHPMWAHVIDTHGRRRISIFYGPQNALDRDAFTYVTSVYDYVTDCMRTQTKPITDDTWATPAAIVEAAQERAKEADRQARMWSDISGRDAHAATQRGLRDVYMKLAAEYERQPA